MRRRGTKNRGPVTSRDASQWGSPKLSFKFALNGGATPAWAMELTGSTSSRPCSRDASSRYRRRTEKDRTASPRVRLGDPASILRDRSGLARHGKTEAGADEKTARYAIAKLASDGQEMP
jgi:hypothetical protein